MNYVLSHSPRSGTARRGGLLGIVIALHAGLLCLVMMAKTVVPALLETPLMVQFIEPPKPLEMGGAPRSPPPAPPKREVARPPRPIPAPPRKAPTPPTPLDTPPLETTASSEPAPASAPVVAEPLPASASTLSSSGGGAGTSVAVGSGGDGSGDSVGARFDAGYLKNPAPPYPPQSRRIGEEGKVILRVFVTADGSAQQVEIKTSSGSDRLDESAQRTVRRWKFIPARRGGIAVESWVLVPIVFKLEQ